MIAEVRGCVRCYEYAAPRTLAMSSTKLRSRRAQGSHLFYKTPWQGEPLVNIQSMRGMAKPYQVRQVIKAIDKLEEESP